MPEVPASPPTSIHDKAAQLVFARIGSNMPPPVTVAEDAERMEALLERCPLGGLILFNGRLSDTPETLARLQAQSRYPLLVATDMERGVGQQVDGATVFPHAMAFAALGDEAEAAVEEVARVGAREALACGIQWAFCPDADVNRDRRNPIIGTRAYGTDADTAARLVSAYIRGCRAEGLLTTAKHFPGHGATTTDSHAELPEVHDPRQVLERTDFVPFRAAIDAGVDAMMTAHVAYEALEPGVPATASRRILHDLLRGEMGFDGVVVTDSLLMSAVRVPDADVGRQAAALVQAGVDVLLDAPDPEAAVEGLVRAVEDGMLSEARLEDAVARVWAMKRRLIDRFDERLFTAPQTHLPAVRAQMDAYGQLAADVARRAVVAVEACPQVPLAPERVADEGLLVVLIKPHHSRLEAAEQPLGQAVREAYPEAVYREVGPEAEPAAFDDLLDAARGVRHVVVAMVVKPAAWHRFGLQEAQQRFVERLVDRQPVLVASLGSPYALDAFPDASGRLCTYSDVPASQRALVYALGHGVPVVPEAPGLRTG